VVDHHQTLSGINLVSERKEMRRLAESYDEEEHRRLIEVARPSQT